MARSRAAMARKPKTKKKNKGKSKKSPQELLDLAQAAWPDVETAASYYRQAVQQLRQRQQPALLLHALEQLGEANVSLNDPDAALENFQEALTVLDRQPQASSSPSSPTTSSVTSPGFHHAEMRASLCLYIGQLSTENDALKAYHDGIKSLEACLEMVEEHLTQDGDGVAKSQAGVDNVVMDDDDDDDEDEENKPLTPQALKASLVSRLSGAYCSIAELFLSDLCFHEHAEAECERYIQAALALDGHDDDDDKTAPLQVAASLRLSQQRPDDAAEYMLQVYQARLQVGCEALAELVGLNGEDKKNENEEEAALELQNVDAVNALPDFEFRCQTAKLLLECANGVTDASKKPALLTAAVSVLGSLLAQNDEVVEVWYLTGCAFCALKDGGAAVHYLNQAKAMLLAVQEGLKAALVGRDDSEIQAELEGNASQMQDVETRLAEAVKMMGGDNDDGDAVDEMEE